VKMRKGPCARIAAWETRGRRSEFDVQFVDLEKLYAFGVGVFDNAQVRHAYTAGVLKLTFE